MDSLIILYRKVLQPPAVFAVIKII